MSQTTLIIIVVAAVVVLLALAIPLTLRLRRRKRIAEMKPEERELYEAQRQFDSDVTRAERTLHSTRETWDKREKEAEQALVDAQSVGYRPLGTYKKLKLFEDHLEAPEGTFAFGTGPVNVTLDSAQRLATVSQEVVSRAGKEVVREFMTKATEASGANAQYLLVDTPIFVNLTPVDDDAAKARQFSTTLASAAASRDQIMTRRNEIVAAAQAELDATRRDKEVAIGAAEAQLEAVQSDRTRLAAAHETYDRLHAEPAESDKAGGGQE